MAAPKRQRFPSRRCTHPAFQCPSHVTRLLHTTSSARAGLSIRNFAPKTRRVKATKSSLPPVETAPPQNIAIIGGGLAGLSVAYHLLNSTARCARKRGLDHTTLSVTIFDGKEAGAGGASAAAAGLLHPFTPRVKKMVWKGESCMADAMALLEVVEGRGVEVMKRCGMVRLALSERAEEDFRQAAGRFPSEVQFLEAGEVAEICPMARKGFHGVFVKKAVVVDMKRYLRGLWEACEESGRARWVVREVAEVGGFVRGGEFDTVVLCAGVGVVGMEDVDVRMTVCRGQNVVLERKRGEGMGADGRVPLISGKYIVPDYFGEGGVERVVGGATFEYVEEGGCEKEFVKEACRTNVERAVEELGEPLERIVPDLMDEFRVVDCVAGSRALPPRSESGSIPIAGVLQGEGIGVSAWVFTGLGSRGLLHHSYLGKKVARAIVSGRGDDVPSEARKVSVYFRG